MKCFRWIIYIAEGGTAWIVLFIMFTSSTHSDIDTLHICGNIWKFVSKWNRYSHLSISTNNIWHIAIRRLINAFIILLLLHSMVCASFKYRLTRVIYLHHSNELNPNVNTAIYGYMYMTADRPYIVCQMSIARCDWSNNNINLCVNSEAKINDVIH